ncbi:hypothetical protein [Bacillus cereus]|uniref:hypothetical protein n=1 Tax=Bacillus cereus TaxID=1396 RepID=UPI0015D4AB7D|nr:hypothetical protein [Bacillus cereus]
MFHQHIRNHFSSLNDAEYGIETKDDRDHNKEFDVEFNVVDKTNSNNEELQIKKGAT